MNIRIGRRVITVIAATWMLSGAGRLLEAQSPPPNTIELVETLFVQSTPVKDGKRAIQVVWIPEPLQKYCLGKTSEQCSTMDYCIRTTNRNVAMCRNLNADLTRMPSYPAGMRPRRVMSVVLFRMSPQNGFGALQEMFDSAPRESLERFSLSARIKARIKLTRKPDDDDLYIQEVLAVAPF